MNTKQSKSIFSTDNFALAIFLKAKLCKLLHINKKDHHHSFFEFEDNPERQKLTKDFWEGKGLVEPRTFYNTQRELKTLLYDDSYPVEND